MARKPFVVIDAEILSSSVWSEAPHVKLVWLTLLILCDTEGYVGAAVPGIARAAGVTVDQARDALRLFMLPDPDSRTQAHDGKRLEPAERGFRILNFREHLDRLSAERTKARDRVRKFRERKRQQADGNVTVPAGNREQRTGNRDVVPEPLTVVGREVLAPPGRNAPPARLPSDRAEQATDATIRKLQIELGTRLAKLSEHENSRLMLPDWCRKATCYDRKDGTRVQGVADYRTIYSIDRLEKSIADADRWLKRLDAGPLEEKAHGIR